jgi:membrane protease YdiL (CAAX protease family)
LRPPVELGTLPFGAVGAAAAGLVVGFLASAILGGVVLAATGGPVESAPVTVASLVGLWIGLLGACVVASRRFGTGRLRADLGIRLSWMDGPRGVGANLGGRVAATVVSIPLVAAGLTSSNTKIISSQKGSTVGFVIVAVAAVVGAPIVEEMFFRGLLLRSLASRLPFGAAVMIQAVVFGLAHANPSDGWRTLSLVAITATFGVTQGLFSRRWSLAALMVSHGLFNLLPVLIIAAR